MRNRIGFFGGCFNPVTYAHINLIKEVIEKENLYKVYFVPMGDFYQKKDLIDLKDRIEMIKIALKNEEKLDILNISNRDKKTDAIDTFKLIDTMFPEDERFFIMGSDNYKKIDTWKNATDLIEHYHYIILDRENIETKNISSSKVREKIKQNENIENLVPVEVIQYIEQKKLYK